MVALVSLIVSHFATVPVTRGSGSGCGSTAAMFVDDSGSAGPLAEALQVLDEFVAPSEPERLVVAGQHDYEVAADWKILTDSYHECYHCPSIHAALCQVSPPRSGENYVALGAYVGARCSFGTIWRPCRWTGPATAFGCGASTPSACGR